MSPRPVVELDWLNGDVSDLRARYQEAFAVGDKGSHFWDALKGPFGQLRVLVQDRRRPAAQDCAIVYFHGGGWIVGSPLTHGDISRGLCEGTGLRVLSVDYRLAPEHRAPAPVDDGLVVLRQFLSERDGEGSRRVILCGDSSGAAIALAVERAASPELRQHVFGVVALYGCYGVMDKLAFQRWGRREQGLDQASVERMWKLANREGVASPYGIDALAAVSDVPVYLLLATRDPLATDSRVLAAALATCNRRVDVDVTEGAMHGFLHDAGSSRVATAAMKRVCNWIVDLLRA